MVPKIVRGTTLGGDHFSYDRPRRTPLGHHRRLWEYSDNLRTRDTIGTP